MAIIESPPSLPGATLNNLWRVAVRPLTVCAVTIVSLSPSAAMAAVHIAAPMSQASQKPDLVAGVNGQVTNTDGQSKFVYTTPEQQQEAFREDLRKFYPDISDQEADKNLEASQAMLALAVALESDHGDSYSRYEVQPGKLFTATIYLKNPRAATLAAISAANIPGVSVSSTAKVTRIEENQLLAAAGQAIVKPELIEGATTTFNQKTGAIEVDLDPRPGLTVKDVLTRAKAPLGVHSASTYSPSSAPGATASASAVPVIYAEKESFEPNLLTGGTALSQRSNTEIANPKHVCTAGFTANGISGNAAGKIGILTADHCPDFMYYEGDVPLTKTNTYNSTVLGDGQFMYALNNTIRREFVWDRNSLGQLQVMPAASTGSIGVGKEVCMYGTTTAIQTGHRQCDRVEEDNARVDQCNTDGTNCNTFYNQVYTVNKITDPGDSGGPVYWGTTAVGLISGSSVSRWSTNYQPISDAERRTGAKVKIN